MRVRVLYFGVLKELVGVEGELVEVPEGSTVGELLRLSAARTSKQSEVWKALAVAVNREYVAAGTVLREDDEVALLPPVSGGCGRDAR